MQGVYGHVSCIPKNVEKKAIGTCSGVMADSGEPLPTGRLLIAFSNAAKYGDFEGELWCKEAPGLCETLVRQLPSCTEVLAGVVKPKEYITFTAGIKMTLRAEHSKLALNRRGLLVVDAESGDLIVTLGPVAMSGSWSVIGRIVGAGFYNLFRFDEAFLNEDGRPVYEIKIDRFIVLDPGPFHGGQQPAKKPPTPAIEPVAPRKTMSTNNAKLLSFADSDEENIEGRVKSVHDVINDPRFAAEPVTVPEANDVPEPVISAKEPVGLVEGSGKPAIFPGKPAEPHMDGTLMPDPVIPCPSPEDSAVDASINAFLSTHPRSRLGKRRPDADTDTLLALNSFCQKLRSESSVEDQAQKTRTITVCKLHGLVNCGSCRSTFGRATEGETEAGVGWMRHRLESDESIAKQ